MKFEALLKNEILKPLLFTSKSSICLPTSLELSQKNEFSKNIIIAIDNAIAIFNSEGKCSGYFKHEKIGSGCDKKITVLPNDYILIGEGRHLRIFNPKDGSLVRELNVGGVVKALANLSDGNIALAITFWSHNIGLFKQELFDKILIINPSNGQFLKTFSLPIGVQNIKTLAFLPDRKIVVSSDNKICIFDLITEKWTKSIYGVAKNNIEDILVLPNNKILAIGSCYKDKMVIFNSVTGKLLKKFQQDGFIKKIGISEEGQLIAVYTCPNEISIFDLKTGRNIKKVKQVLDCEADSDDDESVSSTLTTIDNQITKDQVVPKMF